MACMASPCWFAHVQRRDDDNIATVVQIIQYDGSLTGEDPSCEELANDGLHGRHR